MWIKDTPENRSLAAVVARNAKAAAALNLAKRAVWEGGGVCLRLVGLGVMFAGLGYGANLASEAYDRAIGAEERQREQDASQAKMIEAQAQVERERQKNLAAILAQSRDDLRAILAATTIHTEGTVTGEVGVKEGAQVGVKGGEVPRLSREQVQPDARPESKAAVKTDVVVFKQVDFGAGVIVTGWEYRTAADASPSGQFCHYRSPPAASGTETLVEIGRDGRMALHGKSLAGVNLRKAFASCVWFQSTTRSAQR